MRAQVPETGFMIKQNHYKIGLSGCFSLSNMSAVRRNGALTNIKADNN
jgi:hypothetical protein